MELTSTDEGAQWREIGKSFERSGPVGPVHPVTAVGHPSQGRILLKVNGQDRQTGEDLEALDAQPILPSSVMFSGQLLIPATNTLSLSSPSVWATPLLNQVLPARWIPFRKPAPLE